MRQLTPLILVLLLACSVYHRPAVHPLLPQVEDKETVRQFWWKGNLHTHSLWSDGDDYPEVIVDWYKQHGYHFMALSDHNSLAEGENWINVARSDGGIAAFNRYVSRFGSNRVKFRRNGDQLEARLSTFSEYRLSFEEPGRFLILQAEEISDRFGELPIHVNATNLVEVIPPQGGGTVIEMLQNNVDAVLAQRRRLGVPMFPHVNHPNFYWAVTPEDLIALEGERFFEVYNGHPLVNNTGDEARPGTEEMWDIILAARLEQGDEVLYGLAVDDAHNYHDIDSRHSNPGRGWVMVLAPELTTAALISALEAGRFYATTGVELESVYSDGNRLFISIRPEEGVTYTTRYIGKRGTASVSGTDQPSFITSSGGVMAEVEGISPTYAFHGDELYVRAKVISSKVKENPYRAGEFEVAWTQPFRPGLPTP